MGYIHNIDRFVFLFTRILMCQLAVDDEIESMTIDDLLHIEHDLRDQNSRVDKHIASLHGRLEKLRQKQDSLEKMQKKVGAARDYEVRQRRAREKDLERAHAELESKKNQVKQLAEEAEKLRMRIREMSETVLNLSHEKHRLEAEYSHPSLQDALLHDAQRAGPVPQHVANKTMEVLFPELRVGLEEAAHIHYILQKGPPIAAILTSFVVYVFAVSLLWMGYRSVRTVARRITLGRALFTVDITFAFIWMIVDMCYLLISGDPFEAIAKRQKGLSLIIQMILVSGLLCNVLLRCVFISGCLMKCNSIIELICVIFVAQHYYQGVWAPILFDEAVTNNTFSYFLYALINGGLAVHRARAMSRPVEKLRTEFEEVDGMIRSGEWLRSKMERTFRICEDWLTSGALECEDEESLGNNGATTTGGRGALNSFLFYRR